MSQPLNSITIPSCSHRETGWFHHMEYPAPLVSKNCDGYLHTPIGYSYHAIHPWGVSTLTEEQIMSTVSLAVSGMTCNHCVAAVRKAIDSVPGAHAEDVRIGAARVAMPDDAGAELTTAVVDAIADAGYEAQLAPAGTDTTAAS